VRVSSSSHNAKEIRLLFLLSEEKKPLWGFLEVEKMERQKTSWELVNESEGPLIRMTSIDYAKRRTAKQTIPVFVLLGLEDCLDCLIWQVP
jgi:hypothetical protein